MMHQVYKTLPDDRPITGIQIVEDPDKCPVGYIVVSRTHDQDSDADLWREGGFFGRKATRYVCISKTEGIGDYIVESVVILNEKEVPPDGFSLLPRTIDSEQKAWRKRQMCYRLSKRTLIQTAVTDIIVLSKMKKAPEGFSFAGEINGMTICYKMSSLCLIPKATPPTQLQYSLAPVQTPTRPAPKLPPKPPKNDLDESPHEYERLIVHKPLRPAPRPPKPEPVTYATMATYHGLEGIPFVLHPGLLGLPSGITGGVPVVKARTRNQLDREFAYDFRTEQQT